MKGSLLVGIFEYNYEPYRNMCKEFVLRLYQTAVLRTEQVFISPCGSTLLPKDLVINYDKKLNALSKDSEFTSDMVGLKSIPCYNKCAYRLNFAQGSCQCLQSINVLGMR